MRFREGRETILLPSGGNQCAIITSAHSPCWMEVSEKRPPDWAECPRNPKFMTNDMLDLLRIRLAAQEEV
jgi:hypothetical protein